MRKYKYNTIDKDGNTKEHFVMADTKAEAIKSTENYEFIDGSKIIKSSFKWVD